MLRSVSFFFLAGLNIWKHDKKTGFSFQLLSGLISTAIYICGIWGISTRLMECLEWHMWSPPAISHPEHGRKKTQSKQNRLSRHPSSPPLMLGGSWVILLICSCRPESSSGHWLNKSTAQPETHLRLTINFGFALRCTEIALSLLWLQTGIVSGC